MSHFLELQDGGGAQSGHCCFLPIGRDAIRWAHPTAETRRFLEALSVCPGQEYDPRHNPQNQRPTFRPDRGSISRGERSVGPFLSRSKHLGFDSPVSTRCMVRLDRGSERPRFVRLRVVEGRRRAHHFVSAQRGREVLPGIVEEICVRLGVSAVVSP